VTVRPPQPAFLAAHAVGVRLAEQAVDQNLTSVVSVRVDDPGLRPVVAPGVGVQVFGADPITTVADTLGVRVAPADAFSQVSQVSVALEPVISSVEPSSGTPGSDMLVTIAGSGLAGATSLTFLVDNEPDTSIRVTGLTVAPDGTEASAQISISSTAALGPRVMQITTPAGPSTAAGTGGNVFTVQ
jgi:hypothetical protein